MKKFNFNLETVLSIRENVEKQWEAKLGKANSDCQLIINKIEDYKTQILTSKNSTVDIYQFQVKCTYEDRLKQQISIENKNLQEKEKIRDQIKEVYLEKSRDRKIIDKLKDKSVTKHKKYIIKEDNLFIDEINNSSKIREKMLEGEE